MNVPGCLSGTGLKSTKHRLRASDWISLGILFGGTALRIHHWMSARSLWQDEAYLAVNIVSRDIVELMRPLELNQSAPYLFLAATDALTMVLGDGELVLRLVPLLASIATLVLFWLLARQCLTPWTVPIALSMTSFLYPNIYYAQEFKQYSVEVLVVVSALWLLSRLFRDPGGAARHFGILGIFGAFAIFLSHPAPFVLGGVGAVCFYGRVRGQIRIPYSMLFTVGGVWLGLFALNYLFFIRPAETSSFMAHYWAFAFPDPPWTGAGLKALIKLSNEYVNYLGYTGIYKAAFGLLGATGTFVAMRSARPAVLAALGGLVCFVVAVALGKFPFYGRLGLFLFPMGVLIIATGLGAFGKSYGRLLGIVSGFLLLVPLWPQMERGLMPIVVENQREVIARLVERRAANEPVYVIFYAQPALIYYRSKTEDLPGTYTFGSVRRLWDPPPPGTTRPPRSKPDLDLTLAEIGRLTDSPRFWVLAAHMEMHEPALLTRICSDYGYVPLAVLKEKGAGAYLLGRVQND